MTDNDLRLRVARALGWSNFWYGDGIILADAPEATIEDDRSPLPNWPADWSAAGELLDIITAAGLEYSIDTNSGDATVVIVRRVEGKRPEVVAMHAGGDVKAAIAEAFCKWREAKG